ncbi:hypothetical protein ACOSQ2_010855 [Xanthoceras sorbifolium]
MISSRDKVVGPNSVRLVSETTSGKDLSIGTVDRPVKLDKAIIGPGQLPDMDEVIGQIECSQKVGLSENSSVI